MTAIKSISPPPSDLPIEDDTEGMINLTGVALNMQFYRNYFNIVEDQGDDDVFESGPIDLYQNNYVGISSTPSASSTSVMTTTASSGMSGGSSVNVLNGKKGTNNMDNVISHVQIQNNVIEGIKTETASEIAQTKRRTQSCSAVLALNKDPQSPIVKVKHPILFLIQYEILIHFYF